MISKLNVWLIIGLMLSVFSGCAVLDTVSKNESQLAVQYATLKVLERDGVDRAKLIELVEQARSYVSDEDSILVSSLANGARERLQESNLSFADKMDITAILDTAQERLEARIGSSLLSQDDRVKLIKVQDWIYDVAVSSI
jgi:fructose-1-phosphate kinase PfkB-like protein